jgi:hypothetical protein
MGPQADGKAAGKAAGKESVPAVEGAQGVQGAPLEHEQSAPWSWAKPSVVREAFEIPAVRG